MKLYPISCGILLLIAATICAPMAVAETPRGLIIVSGGLGSCTRDSQQPHPTVQYMQDQQQALSAQGISSDQILICFGKDRNHVELSSTFETPQTVIGSAEEVLETLVGQMNRFPGDSVFLTGHSYGGWMIMQAALHAARNITLLATLDAISYTDCRFEDFLEYEWAKLIPIGQNGGNYACTTSPPDITEEQRKIIRDSVTFWINFYQTEDKPLHSSAIIQADENFEKVYNEVNAHSKLVRDPEVKDYVTRKVSVPND